VQPVLGIDLPPAQLLVGIAPQACFLGLMGLAYMINEEGAGVINLAVGAYATFAALFCAELMQGHSLGLLPATVFALILAALLGLATEMVIVRPIRHRSSGQLLPALVAIVALLFGLQQLAGELFGTQLRRVTSWWAGVPLEIGGVVIDRPAIVLVTATIAVYGAMVAWLRMAPLGRLLRAVGDREETAHVIGLPVGRVRIVTFLLTGAIAGLAGVLSAQRGGVSFLSAFNFSLSGFVAFVIGGRGALYGPFAGGVLLAAAEVLFGYYFGAAVVTYVTFGAALLFFAVRPEGLFAKKVRV
jgi:branched-chain amino acid transport system permease protein